MVEDRVADATRIGQLLASELTGRKTGPLCAVSVVEADPDAEPAPEGTAAFAIEFEGDRVGCVSLFPRAVAIELDAVAAAAVRARATGPDLAVDDAGETVTLRVESGAAVKRAVDALIAGLDEQGSR